MHLHVGMVSKPVEQLGGDEEVLARMLCAGDVDHAGVDQPVEGGVSVDPPNSTPAGTPLL